MRWRRQREMTSDSAPVSRVVNKKPKASKASAPSAPKSVRSPSPALEAQLLAEYGPIVRQIAGGFQRRLPRNVLRDDLIAAGMSGLWDAIRKHGEERAGNF